MEGGGGGNGDKIHQHPSPYKVESAMCHKKGTDRVLWGLREGEIVKFTLLVGVTPDLCHLHH